MGAGGGRGEGEGGEEREAGGEEGGGAGGGRERGDIFTMDGLESYQRPSVLLLAGQGLEINRFQRGTRNRAIPIGIGPGDVACLAHAV